MKKIMNDIYIYIYNYGKKSKYGRGCGYLVTAPHKWKGARHKYYFCSFLLSRGAAL